MPTFAYVANANKVSVIDTSTNTVVNTIPVEPANNILKLMAITPDGRSAYVTSLYSTVSVIDTCTNAVADTIMVGDVPAGIAVTPNGESVYVANSGLATSPSGTVSVIDTAANTVIDTIPVGRGPIGIAITPDGRFAYVTIAKADSVAVIDTAANTVVKTIPVGDFPQGIAITPDGKLAYVANQGQSTLTNNVSVIATSTNTVVDTITVGIGPTWIAITPDSRYAYVTNSFDGNVSVIDTVVNEVVDTVPVGSIPFIIAITPDGNYAYVTNFISNTVSVIDITTNTVVDTIPDLYGPLGIAIGDIPPCPAPSESICIETTRIFDSCLLEEEQRETIKVPDIMKEHDIHCEITETQCDILKVSGIDEQQDLADIKLRIKVCVQFTGKCFHGDGMKRAFCFDKNITLIVPEGADVCCDVQHATCECMQISGVSCNPEPSDRICCTVKVTAVVKSKKLIQIEVPFLRSCEPKQCSSYEGTPVAPGKSYPLPNEPSAISRILFAAKTKPGTTSRLIAYLDGIPYTFAAVTEVLKPFAIDLPGGLYPVENISLKNMGESTIYIYKLTTR